MNQLFHNFHYISTLKNLTITDNKLTDQISSEIDRLNLMFTHLCSANSTTYIDFLLQLSTEQNVLLDEAELLETVIPIWASSRGNKIPQDKSVDDFYAEFELVTLCMLLNKFANGDKSSELIMKLRSIIRRYSNMPTMWRYLCQISGDNLTDSYTF